MLLFGHKFIPSKKFYHVYDIDAVRSTPPSSLIYLDFDEENLDIISYLYENEIHFALRVKNITQIIYASALNASYIVVEEELAKTAQKIAENYLFDAKILVHIQEDDAIEELALLGVDGVIFPSAVVHVNS